MTVKFSVCCWGPTRIVANVRLCTTFHEREYHSQVASRHCIEKWSPADVVSDIQVMDQRQHRLESLVVPDVDCLYEFTTTGDGHNAPLPQTRIGQRHRHCTQFLNVVCLLPTPPIARG